MEDKTEAHAVNLTKAFKLAQLDKVDFDAQIIAALMIQTNALVSIKTAVVLSSLSRQGIDKRVHQGTFPKPTKLSGEQNSIRKAFRVLDLLDWLDNPMGYRVEDDCSYAFSQHADNKPVPKK